MYISVSVDLDDGEGSFSRRGELGFLSTFILLLYDKDFVTNLIVMRNGYCVIPVSVCNGLAVALQFQHLLVDLCVLPENHIHSKGQMAMIVG